MRPLYEPAAGSPDTPHRERTRAENSRCRARHTRNWNPIAVVTLSPRRDTVIKAAAENLHNSKPAA